MFLEIVSQLMQCGFGRKIAVLAYRVAVGIDNTETLAQCNIITTGEWFRIKDAVKVVDQMTIAA